MPFHYLPEAVEVRIIRRALVHEAGPPVGERSIDYVAVAGHPADIRRTPVDVFVLEVENPLGGKSHVSQIPAGRMYHTLRFARRAAGVKDKERILGVHLDRGTLLGHIAHEILPPHVPTRFHLDCACGALGHDHMFHRGGGFECQVHVGLELDHRTPPPAPVCGNHCLYLGVVDPIAQRFGAKAAEYHRVRGAEASAG